MKKYLTIERELAADKRPIIETDIYAALEKKYSDEINDTNYWSYFNNIEEASSETLLKLYNYEAKRDLELKKYNNETGDVNFHRYGFFNNLYKNILKNPNINDFLTSHIEEIKDQVCESFAVDESEIEMMRNGHPLYPPAMVSEFLKNTIKNKYLDLFNLGNAKTWICEGQNETLETRVEKMIEDAKSILSNIDKNNIEVETPQGSGVPESESFFSEITDELTFSNENKSFCQYNIDTLFDFKDFPCDISKILNSLNASAETLLSELEKDNLYKFRRLKYLNTRLTQEKIEKNKNEDIISETFHEDGENILNSIYGRNIKSEFNNLSTDCVFMSVLRREGEKVAGEIRITTPDREYIFIVTNRFLRNVEQMGLIDQIDISRFRP